MDIDPNLGGLFAYSENQENESVYTDPDANFNPASRNVRELTEKESGNEDDSDNNDQQNK